MNILNYVVVESSYQVAPAVQAVEQLDHSLAAGNQTEHTLLEDVGSQAENQVEIQAGSQAEIQVGILTASQVVVGLLVEVMVQKGA